MSYDVPQSYAKTRNNIHHEWFNRYFAVAVQRVGRYIPAKSSCVSAMHEDAHTCVIQPMLYHM